MLLPPKDFLEKEVELKDIFLDPNNPRFANEKDAVISDDKIVEPAVQEKCLIKMRDYGIDELKESVKRVGFVQVDKVVVRPLKSDAFVVVEGNRRIAALKILAKEITDSEVTLEAEILNTILKFRVFVYTGHDKDIAWVVQGIRHISGIRNWPAYQQAQTLIKLARQGAKVKDAAEIVGIKALPAVRLIKAMNGYEQAKADEEYGEDIKPDLFVYFAEVIFKEPVLQKYLGWDEKSKRFKNETNFKKLLSWIFPEEGKEPKITRAMQLRDDLVPVMISHPELFERWENDPNMTIKILNIDLGKELAKHAAIDVSEWLEKIDDFNDEMKELPVLKIKDKKADFKAKLEETQKIIRAHLGILSKL